MNNRYGISDINHFGVLKVSFPLILIFAFMTRHWWLAVGTMMSRSPAVMNEFFDGSITYFLVAEFPALLLWVMAMNRKPEAGKVVRGIWKVGVPLLALSVVLNLAVLALLPTRFSLDLSRLDGLQWGAALANLCILGYMLFLPRIRDTFGEFPAPPAEPAP